MDLASCDFKITAFPCKFMIDLVSIRDHSPEAEVSVSTDDIDTGKVTVVGIFKHGTPL